MVVSLTRSSSGGDALEATGTFTGPSVDISSLGNQWELVLHVLFLTPEKRALFHVQGSEDDFKTTLPGPTFNPSGEVKSVAPRKYVASSRDFPSLPFGKPGGKLRLNLVALDPSANVRYSAFVRLLDS
jgi:hypothetical protein